MTVIVNIWRGKLPQFTVWNAIYGLNVGHASMLVIDDENPEDTIYISHRPQIIENSSNSGSKSNNKDTSKKYALGDIFTQKAKPISFYEDCERRGKEAGQVRQPDHKIKILALNEDRIRVFYKMYSDDKLPEEVCQYHCLLYTSDAADDMQCVDLGGRRIIKKKKTDATDRHSQTIQHK